jgi:hypothetical protein
MSILSLSPTNIYLSSDSPGPFIPSLTLAPPIIVTRTTYKPIVPLPPWLDLNQDSNVHNQMAKYFYFKVIDKWLFDDLLDLLSYLRVSDKGVDVIHNLRDHKSSSVDKDTQETVEKKIKFIEKNIFDVENMHKLLKKFVAETNTNWYDLVKQEYFIKDLVRKYLKKKLIRIIESK